MPYRLGLAALVVTRRPGSSYVGGQTMHIDLTYPSFAADLTPSEWPVAQLASGGTTANMTIAPNCDDCPSPPYREHDEITVIWTGGGFLLQGGIYCQVPTGSCGSTLDGSAF